MSRSNLPDPTTQASDQTDHRTNPVMALMKTTTTMRFILTQLETASMTMMTMKIGRIQVETVLMILTGTAGTMMVKMSSPPQRLSHSLNQTMMARIKTMEEPMMMEEQMETVSQKNHLH